MIKIEYRDNKELYNSYIKYIDSEKITDYSEYPEHWSNIPVNVEWLKFLYRYYKDDMFFVDLGCGSGQVLRFAKNIGYNVEGIDIDDYKELNKELNFKQKDIRKIKSFSKWDIIYLYEPLKGDHLDSLISKIINTSKEGALIVTINYFIESDLVEALGDFVYRKIKK